MTFAVRETKSGVACIDADGFNIAPDGTLILFNTTGPDSMNIEERIPCHAVAAGHWVAIWVDPK